MMKDNTDKAAEGWFVFAALLTAVVAVLFSGLPGRITETFDGIVASL